jgi:hypothetical protein
MRAARDRAALPAVAEAAVEHLPEPTSADIAQACAQALQEQRASHQSFATRLTAFERIVA